MISTTEWVARAKALQAEDDLEKANRALTVGNAVKRFDCQTTIVQQALAQAVNDVEAAIKFRSGNSAMDTAVMIQNAIIHIAEHAGLTGLIQTALYADKQAAAYFS